MDYDGFINRWLGKAIDWDGMYGAQCVDEIAQYCSDNNKPVAYANAKDWWQHPSLIGAFDFIANDPNDPNQLPNRGDVVIFNGNQPGSGGYGHINIFDMQQDTDHWQGLDQNWGGQYVHFVTGHVWTYVIGWMRPKAAPAPIPAPDPAPDPGVPPAPIPDPTTTVAPETTTTTTTQAPTTTATTTDTTTAQPVETTTATTTWTTTAPPPQVGGQATWFEIVWSTIIRFIERLQGK